MAPKRGQSRAGLRPAAAADPSGGEQAADGEEAAKATDADSTRRGPAARAASGILPLFGTAHRNGGGDCDAATEGEQAAEEKHCFRRARRAAPKAAALIQIMITGQFQI